MIARILDWLYVMRVRREMARWDRRPVTVCRSHRPHAIERETTCNSLVALIGVEVNGLRRIESP